MSTTNTLRSAYMQNNGPIFALQQPPIVSKRAPGANDKAALGTIWVQPSTDDVWILASIINNSATWVSIAGAGGVFSSLTVSPGPISLTGTTTINTSGAASTSIGTGSNSGVTTIGNAATPGSGVAINVGSGNFVVSGNGNAIAIGADAAANTVLLGSLTTGATTAIDGGNSTGVGSAAITLGTAAAGDIQIGLSSQTGAIHIAPSTGSHILNISNGINTGAAVVNISAGASGANSTVNILSGNATAGTQTLNALTGTRAGVVNIGTGAAAHVITIGSSTVGNVTNLSSPITALPGPVFIYTGSGTPSNGLALHVGDLYINTTAATATTRMFIATAASTWTNVTCAA